MTHDVRMADALLYPPGAVHPYDRAELAAEGNSLSMDTPRMGIDEDLAGRLSMAEQHAWLRERHSRRRVIRGGVAAAGTVAGAGVLGASAYAGREPAAAPARFPTAPAPPAAVRVDGALVAPF